MQWRNLQEWNTPPHWWRWHLLRTNFESHTLGITTNKKVVVFSLWKNKTFCESKHNLLQYTFLRMMLPEAEPSRFFGGLHHLESLPHWALRWFEVVRFDAALFFFGGNCKVCLGATSKALVIQNVIWIHKKAIHRLLCPADLLLVRGSVREEFRDLSTRLACGGNRMAWAMKIHI